MKRLVLASIFMLCAMASFGQRDIDMDSKPSFKERLYFGGGMGLNGGSNYFYIGLFPTVGYMVNEKFSVGTSINYQYYSYTGYNVSFHQYGFSPFMRYNLDPQLFLYSELMFLNSPTFDNSTRRTYNRFLNGVGFTQRLGERSSLNVVGLYDVIYNETDRVFNSPWVFRVFFSF